MAERASSKQYLVVDENGKGHLPVRDTPDGPLNHHLMGAAWAALHGGYRGNKYEGPGKEAALAKLKALYKSEGMDLPDSSSADGQVGKWADGQMGSGQVAISPSAYLPSTLLGDGERSRTVPTSLSAQLADCPRFVATLAEPPATGLIRIPIAVTGKWRGADKEFSVGLDDLHEIRENFAKKPTGEINVDYEHASEVPFGTGAPVLSAGRVIKLDEPENFNGTGKQILWGWYEPTARARALIANKEYRYVSPAIRWGAKDKVTGKSIGTVLTSVALVNKPFLEELPQLHLSEVGGEARILVSLGQLHVPGPVNQISVAYGQPEKDSGFSPRSSRGQDSGPESRILNPESLSAKEKTMATKTLKLKCLTAADLEKHGLPDSHKGKIGVFDGDEHIGTAEHPDGWHIPEAEGNGDGDGTKSSESFASEVGMAGKSLVEIAAMVRRGLEAPVDQFAALSEALHGGKIDIVKAGQLADAGRVRFSTILAAQEAERKVDDAIKAGKVLPKNRVHALKLALSDAAGFTALVEQAAPVVDLRTRGHAGGGEQPTAQQVLMGEVNAYAKEHKCLVSVALSEVTKAKPELWREYSEEIVTAVEAAQEEE
jgi:phage I-like protein